MTQSRHVPYAGSASSEYIDCVREHIIKPLLGSPVADHCFAAAMLIFAGIDGLGRLVHEKRNAGAGDRFKDFLTRMGADYQKRQGEIWQLRNSLDHNALNVACYMSKTEDACGEHLQINDGHLFIHTARLLMDFRAAVDALEIELQRDTSLLDRAESRLERACLELPGWRDSNVQTTPPPVVRFAYVRLT